MTLRCRGQQLLLAFEDAECKVNCRACCDGGTERETVVAALKVYYDAEGKTLTVWFDDPEKEFVAEEVGDEVALIKDRRGRVIGFERLNYAVAPDEALAVDAIAV